MQAMLEYTHLAKKLAELRAAHHCTHDKRETDRLDAVVLLATGWTAEKVAEVLQVDPNTVRNHFKRCREGGIEALGRIGANVGGNACVRSTRNSWRFWTPTYEETFEGSYTESCMTTALHRLGHVYK